ncbi:hypothetical protein [Bradyrhizobium sp. BR13661]|jgi:hypothetical protein|uniref:hypothetical protein n=1 Tax=Bradyrhizobium sp. BR13661 TaxID=2940622 RepID=UPI002476EDF4|nr:hypothetical protein [Bradyrhizobium sp. BR13661]MDH6257811.1 hypothetical protein [Bradyrhizobium sp. BR13661]
MAQQGVLKSFATSNWRSDDPIGGFSAMNAQSFHRSRRYRLLLLLLMIIPLLPELVIIATGTSAVIMGWDQKGLCTFASERLSNIVDLTLGGAVSWIVVAVGKRFTWLVLFYVVVSAWLSLCLILICLGWTARLTRLVLGFAVTCVLAILPYFGPWLALTSFADKNCRTNEAGVGTCVIFGGYVENAHDTVRIGWLAWYGIPLVFGIFGIYAIVVGLSMIPQKRMASSGARYFDGKNTT